MSPIKLRTPRRVLFAVLCLAVAMLGSARLAAQELNLVLNQNAIEQRVAKALLQDIAGRAGVQLNAEELPANRATTLTLRGEKDGEVARTFSYGEHYPALLRIEPAYYALTTTVFARRSRNLPINSRADLAPYRIGVVRGITHAEDASAGFAHVERINDYEQMYRMLAAGRIDVAIDTGINGNAMLWRLGLTDIVPVAELARLDLHLYLNAQKKDLAPRLSTAITRMRAAGELTRLTKRYEYQLRDLDSSL